MKNNGEPLTIPLQVGAELRIRKDGEISIDNPEIELALTPQAADAVLSYRFDPKAGEHILRLLDPVANHKHHAKHRPGDQASGQSASLRRKQAIRLRAGTHWRRLASLW